MTEPISKPKRNTLSLSLRVMLVLVLIAGGALGWWANSARRQREAVAAIRQAGGSVIYGYQRPTSAGPRPKPREASPTRKWLYAHLGQDFFESPNYVSLGTHPDPKKAPLVNNALMIQVASLGSVEDLTIYRSNELTGSAFAPLRNHPRMKFLHIYGDRKYGRLDWIEGFTGLQVLGINGFEIREEDSRRLEDLPALEMFATDSQITDADLSHLSRSGRLRRLHAINTRVSTAGLDSLKRLSELEVMILDDLGHPKDQAVTSLSAVRGLTKLTHVTLGNCQLEDSEFDHLAGHPALMVVSLGGANLGDSALKRLGAIPTLIAIRIRAPKATDDGLTRLWGLSKLDFFHLEGAKVRSLRGIERASAMKDLEFRGCPIDDDGLRPVASLKKLTKLRIIDAKLTDAGLAPLAALPKLGELSLAGSEITDAGAETLAGLRGLSGLDLSRTKITDEGLAKLAKLTRLGRLDLDGTAIGDEGLRSIVAMPRLYHVSLKGTKVTDAGVAALKNRRPRMEVVR